MNSVINPALTTHDVDALVRFYTTLGFTEDWAVVGPEGQATTSAMRTPCGQATFMLEHDAGFRRPTAPLPISLYASLPEGVDVDEAFAQFRDGGATITAEPQTQWWGDRTFSFVDPDGYPWTVAKTVQAFDPAMLPAGCTMRAPVTV